MYATETSMSIPASMMKQHAPVHSPPDNTISKKDSEFAEPRSIDEIINGTLSLCETLPAGFVPFRKQIQELHSRLAFGRLHLAVVGEFNRGKSTFVNSLIGMNLVPTSVLPITSVPTGILYGKELSCTVRFLQDKPPVVVKASQETIRSTLLKYVAEENNPKNQFGVRSVEVTVPAPLLANGTMLIDTPGFGSTYLHNTQTALSALADCDAVLFLLSVDPPMTQTEVEFLKLVISQVPRIFFILNKIDLLTSQNLDMVDGFIGEILMSKLHPSVKPNIFKVSAKYAERAKIQSNADPYWVQSGMDAVKNDIVNFMSREKYFTLSQALGDKLRDAVTGICTLLKKDLDAIEAPLVNLKSERDELSSEADAIQKALEKEIALIAVEKKAVIKFFDERLASGRIKLIRQIHEAIDGLLNSTSCSAESLKSVNIALNKILPDALSAYKTRLLSQLSKPFKRAALLHGKEFTATLESMRKCLAGSGSFPESKLIDKLDTIDIEIDDRENEVVPGTILFSLTLGDHLHGRLQRIKRLHARFDHQIDDVIKNDLFAFTKNAKSRIDQAFLILTEMLSVEHEQLRLQLDQCISHKDRAMDMHREKTAVQAENLKHQITSFEGILAEVP